MALVEIDETELVNYRNITGAVQKMLANPQTRSKLLEAQKIINPNAVIPEIDSAKPVYEALDSMKAELKAAKEQREADLAEARKEKAMEGLRSKWEAGRIKARKAGYTEEGMQLLEAFMEEKGVADHEVAMPAFERLHPQQDMVDTSASGKFDVFGGIKQDDDTKMLLEGNEQQFLNKRIRDTLSGVRTGNLN